MLWEHEPQAITTTTARASSVSPSSYTNTIFNQSAHMLFKDCFLTIDINIVQQELKF